MKKIIGYSLFFIVLTIGFLVAVFWDRDLSAKPATISYVKPFSFITQDERLFTEQDMRGKVSVVEYFFTTCKSICPKMNKNMAEIYEEFKDEPDFQIVAYTCDPETDSASRLRHYADSMGIDTKKWHLLTGRKDSLYYTARNSYLLDDPKNNFEKIEDQFLHTQFFALVDKGGNVRGQVYDGLKKDEIAQLKKNIKLLLKEKEGHSGFANSIFTNNPN